MIGWVPQRNRVGMTEPAGQRLPDTLAQAWRDPHVGRRAGAAVEVLVGAADGVVGLGRVQVQRQRAGRVGQVPDRQGAVFVDQAGDLAHVVQVAGLVVDMAEHHHRGIRVDRRRQLLRAIHQAQPVAALEHVGKALGDVQISGEVARFGNDHLAPWRFFLLDPQGGAEHLEQVDRGGVGDHHFAGARADQGRQLVAEALRQAAPVGAVPAADEALAPFRGDHFGGALHGGPGAGAEGVAVEVDHAVGQGEQLAQVGQGIAGVERQAVVTSGHRLLRGRQGAQHGTHWAGIEVGEFQRQGE